MVFLQNQVADEIGNNNPTFFTGSARFTYQGMERLPYEHRTICRVDDSSDPSSLMALIRQAAQFRAPLRLSIDPNSSVLNIEKIMAAAPKLGIEIQIESTADCIRFLETVPGNTLAVNDHTNMDPDIKAFILGTTAEVFECNDAAASTTLKLFGRQVHFKIAKDSRPEELEAFHCAATESSIWLEQVQDPVDCIL